MPKIVPNCPYCHAKMPNDKKAGMGRDGVTVRIRGCECGYLRVETVRVEVKEYFPVGKE